jgi:NitT/TauT family transport system ATP-binding protein
MLTTVAPAKQATPILTAEDVTLQYKTRDYLVTATRRVSFSMFQSDRLVLLGPSGCGKSTLLKAVAGHLKPVSGSILLDEREIDGPGPDRIMVFQEFDQLFPWKTVKENVIFALIASGKTKRPEAEDQALYYLRKVNLEQFVNAYPHTLSGGMKQRVAIARCLAMKPEIILMDEPFAALDALTRQKMQDELLELWSEIKFTMLFVTHSIPEAILLGNRIILLSPHPGRVRAELTVDAAALGKDGEELFRDIQGRIQKILFKDAVDYSI